MASLLLRWYSLCCYLTGICLGQLTNIRPLKGVIYDFDGPKNITMEEVPFLGFGGVGPEVGIPRPPSPFVPPPPAPITTRPPLLGRPPDVAVQSLEVSLVMGTESSMKQQQALNSRPSTDIELSGKFLSAFRMADAEAEAASCVGRALIETSKMHAENTSLTVSLLLDGPQLDQRDCEQVLRKEGCVDFKKPPRCSSNDPYRRIDGSCNNLGNPNWGKSMIPFVRFYRPFYENDFDIMRGEGRVGPDRLPSPRTVSFKLQQIQENPPLDHITLMVMQFGQFLDHELTFTPETQLKNVKQELSRTSTLSRVLANNQEENFQCPKDAEDTMPVECCPRGRLAVDDIDLIDCRPIDVSDDPLFQRDGKQCMRFVRSLIASKGCQLGPREQLNQITAYIDGSAIYGSSDKVAQVLREREGGRLLKTPTGNLLPRSCCPDQSFQCFTAGDTRVNEQPGLISMHTLWLRVHEEVVANLALENPQWANDDEKLYQEARRIVAALMQQVTYREFLPLVVGANAMIEEDLHLLPGGPGFTYDENVDASIANVFATAAFRFGHSLVSDNFKTAGQDFLPISENFQTGRAMFEHNTRPSAILEGLAESQSQAQDFYIILSLTNKLFFSPPELVGLDLMSLNIQRGRDHGLPPYTRWRQACGLQPISSFAELAAIMPSAVAQVFQETYSNVDEIDLFPAALSEFPEDGLVGPTFACLISHQFSNVKKGDRFFFQNLMQPQPFTPEQLQSIGGLSLAAILCHHSDIESLQPNVFQTTGVPGNNLRPCSSYPKLNYSLWKEKSMPPPDVMSCRGVGSFQGRKILDDWCTLNCFHNPSFCPPTHCSCDSNL